MPSLDTIRTVTIRGKTDGVDQATAALNQLTDSIRAANDNLLKSGAAAQASNEGFNSTSLSVATAANHLRQAAEAAYAFSPAFRGVVNEMATPALSAAEAALGAVAAGIVTATNYAGTGLIALAGAAEKVNPGFLGLTSAVRSAGIAMEAFSPTVGALGASILGVAGAIVSRFLPVVGQILLVYDAIKAIGEAWTYGKEKLAEYVELSEKAVASNVSTDFFQRITKAATDANIAVDSVKLALKNLNDATADKLGGSTGSNRLQEHLDVGNFKGNTGVSQLAQSNTNEEKLRALSALIEQAIDKGQRLAALDIAKTFLGPEVAANLAKDSDYLGKMIQQADDIAGSDLIPQAQIDRAVALHDRLDAAEKILSQRWHPIQDLLTELGIKMREVWVGIVEAIASAVDNVFKFGEAIAKYLPSMDKIREIYAFVGRANLSAVPLVGPLATGVRTAASLLSPGSEQTDQGIGDARARLASGLGNHANVDAWSTLGRSIQSKVRGDTSGNPDKKQVEDSTAAYDRATESVLKYIKVTEAAADSVGKTVAEQEKAKVVAQLLAAAEKDGTTVTGELRAEMDKLGDRAAAAAQALEKAKVAADIKFNRDTSFLSQQDVQIATQLKGLYPDVASALGSVEAQGMRANSAFKEISSSIETNLTQGLTDITSGAKTAGQAFTDMGKAIAVAIEQMIIKIMIVEPLMRSLQSSIGGSGILGFLGGSGGATPGVDGLAAIHHTGGVVGGETMPMRYIHPAYFDDAPRFHGGGIAGDEVPIIARKGEGIFTPAQMAALGGGGGANFNVVVNNNGSDQATVKQSQNGSGGIDLEVLIGNAAATQAAKPGSALSQVLNTRGKLAAR